MYSIKTNFVNAVIVGSSRRWVIFLATADGLRQQGPVYRSEKAARTALGAC